MIKQIVRVGLIVLASVTALNYLLLLVLAHQRSLLSVLIAIVAALAMIPLVTKRLGVTQYLKSRLALTIVLLVTATSLLNAGDRHDAEINHIALTGLTVITGHKGQAPIANGTVLINGDGRIEAIGRASDVVIPAGYEVVDQSGKYALPGLINAHSHLILPGRDRDPDSNDVPPVLAMPEWVTNLLDILLRSYAGEKLVLWQMSQNAERAVRGGVTTLRALGDPHFYDVTFREQVASGKRMGPRLLVAGPLLCTTGGHAHQISQVIDGPVEGRRAVRNSLRRGVDVIKIASTGGVSDSRRIGEAGELQMTPEEIEAIVDEAHRKNFLVTAHAESAVGVLEALRAGVDNIEHGAELTEESIALFKDNPKSLRGFSTLHPTLSVTASASEYSEDMDVSPMIRIILHNGADIKKRMYTGFRQAVDGGVHIGVGTDAGLVDHATVWKELQLMIEATGMSNADAIHIGTLATAISIGVGQETGSIEPGKSADILIVDRNPLADITALSAPAMVIAGGWVVD